MVASWIMSGIIVHADPAFIIQTNALPEFITGSKLNIHGRAYYDRSHYKHQQKTEASLAAGGWLDFESGLWHGLGIGLVPYTSQKVYGDKDQDGAGILAPGQKGYSVLGQAYLQGIWLQTRIRLFRQMLDTPFLNPHDTRMTPVTFEAYTLQSTALTNLTLMAGQVTKIKERNSTTFKSMTDAAGFSGTNEPITMAGFKFTPDVYTFQLWNYYCYNFMNVVYAQVDGNWPLTDRFSLSASMQAFDQQDVGDGLGGEFHTGMGGIQGGAGWDGLNLKLSFTTTANNHDIVNPWACYPGYTSIMEEDCNLAGEKAWGIMVAYDFTPLGLKGLSSYINHTEAWTTEAGALTSPEQLETDVTIDYRFCGRLNGLWIRLRAAWVDNALDMNKEDFNEYRVIVNYDIANLLVRQ